MLIFNLGSSRIYFLPFIPENLETSQIIAKNLKDIQPDVIALFLPYFFKEKWLEGIKALPNISVLKATYKNFNEYIFITPICAQVEAVRYANSQRIPLYFIDFPKESEEKEEYSLSLSPYLVKTQGYNKYTETLLSILPLKISEREKFIATRLKEMSKKYKRIVFLVPYKFIKGILHCLKEFIELLYLPQKVPKKVELFTLHPQSIRELLAEPAYFQEVYEKKREEIISGKIHLDRIELFEEIILKAKEKFKEETGVELSPKDFRVFGQYLKNYLLIKNKFVPDLLDLVIVARGIGGDEFAFWVWEIATSYSLSSNKFYPVLKLSPEDLSMPYKNLRFFRKLKSLRQRVRFLKKFTTREERKEFKRSFSGKVICSFPPEDIIVETFGEKAIEKGLRVLSENLRKVEPFTSSLKDGLEIRETIRKWVFEEVPYVMEEPIGSAKAGSVVVIFEEDPDPVTKKEKFPWNFTWHGEHYQESDMAFYATEPSENVVGPGIAKCIYGGFMLTRPPMRVFDIWQDPYFDIAQTKSEKLLLAGIDYSLEKYIVFIAPHPPTLLAKKFASLQGKKIIYLPLGSFSRRTLEKIRIFHVLEGHHLRKIAHKYIQKPP
jgi:hypothetical protein